MTRSKRKLNRELLSILLLIQLVVMTYSAFNDGSSTGGDKHFLDKAQSLSGTWQLWNMFSSHPRFQRWEPSFHLFDGVVTKSGFPEGIREELVSYYLAADSEYGKALFNAFVRKECSGPKGPGHTRRIDFEVEALAISSGKREKRIVHRAWCAGE